MTHSGIKPNNQIMKNLLLAAALTLSAFASAKAQTLADTRPATARKPEISINNGTFTDGKAVLNFNTQDLGLVSASQTLTIDNIGTASLTGLKLVIDGPGKANFKVTKILKTSLSPNLSTSFKIKFKPSQKKPVTATLHLLSNDADEKSFDIKLNGRVGVIITPFVL